MGDARKVPEFRTSAPPPGSAPTGDFTRTAVGARLRSPAMNRNTRLAIRLLAIGVIVVGAVMILPIVLGGLERLLREIRIHWWLLVLVALAIWTLLALGAKKR